MESADPNGHKDMKMRTHTPASNPPGRIPAVAGIGLRGAHHDAFVDGKPSIGWLEAHSENYFAEDGLARATLERIRTHYDMSLHGVGLSLGSTDPISETHLKNLRRLVERIEPALVSEHLSWSSVNGRYLNDLLPLPYTKEAVEHLSSRIVQTQDYLQRPILIENVSGYVEFTASSMSEWEFLRAVAETSGAGILLDVNNIFVNAQNHGLNAAKYIRSIPKEVVGEIHLAGHSEQVFGDQRILVDTHDAKVCDDVWSLYDLAIETYGPKPTLIEWDSKLPSVDVLLAEAAKAQLILDKAHELAA